MVYVYELCVMPSNPNVINAHIILSTYYNFILLFSVTFLRIMLVSIEFDAMFLFLKIVSVVGKYYY